MNILSIVLSTSCDGKTFVLKIKYINTKIKNKYLIYFQNYTKHFQILIINKYEII